LQNIGSIKYGENELRVKNTGGGFEIYDPREIVRRSE